jgi:hypothetical protein
MCPVLIFECQPVASTSERRGERSRKPNKNPDYYYESDLQQLENDCYFWQLLERVDVEFDISYKYMLFAL